jgi:hypothetical protein
MLFESTRILLRGIVQAIEKGDHATWDDHLESGIQCLYELHQMSRPASRAYKIDSKSQMGAPVSDRATHAIPHVKLMVGAIRRRDQAAAVQAGMAAVVEMNGAVAKPVRPVEQPQPAVVPAAAAPVVKPAPAAAPVSVKPAKPVAVAARKPKKPAPTKHRSARPARPVRPARTVAAKRKKLARAASR